METINFDEANVIYGTMLPEDDYMPNTLEICVDRFNTKSHLKIGNMIIHNTHRFNWFHRKMWKLLLGFDIENVKEN